MRAHRFGSKIKLPSTRAIKHQLLLMMFEDEVRAILPGGLFIENESPAFAMLRQLRDPSPACGVGAELLQPSTSGLATDRYGRVS